MLVDPMFFHHFSFRNCFVFLEFNGYIVTKNRYMYVYTYIHTYIYIYTFFCHVFVRCWLLPEKPQIELMYIFIIILYIHTYIYIYIHILYIIYTYILYQSLACLNGCFCQDFRIEILSPKHSPIHSTIHSPDSSPD